MLQDIWNWMEQTMEEFKTFVVNNHGNPLMWLGFFLAGILLFTITYNALTKHKQ